MIASYTCKVLKKPEPELQNSLTISNQVYHRYSRELALLYS